MRSPRFWTVFLSFLVAAAVQAQELTPQQMLMARRAAELDAYRKMAETVQGLQISSRTTVSDFVAQSDEVRAAFNDFVKGIRIIGQPIFQPDGTCEVTVGVTMEQVVQELRTIRQRHYTGNSFHDHTFNQLVNVTQQRMLTATGYGAPGGAGSTGSANIQEAKYPDEIVPPAGFPDKPEWRYVPSPTGGLPGWSGTTGQGRLMALRAAEVDAMRKLTEAIHGVHLTSETRVVDFVAASDEIRADLETFTKGIGTVGPPRFQPDGTCEVEMAVTVSQVIEEVKRIKARRQVGPRIEEKEIIKQREYTQESVIAVSGSGTAPGNTVLRGTRFVGWESVNAREKLLARRTAEVVAYRRLAERINGLRLTARTTVSDFVTQEDLVQVASESVLKGMSQVGETWWYDDGSLQLTLRVPFEVVVKEVFRVIQRGHGPQPPPQEEVRSSQTMKWIVESGYGAVPSRAPYFAPDGAPVQPTAANDPPWSVEALTVTGSGLPLKDAETEPQKRLTAERAAEADAMRKLFERLGGVKINSETTIADFAASHDKIQTEIEGILKGAKKVAVRNLPDGTVEVDMTVDLSLVWAAVQKQMS